jgi:tetratricopeptide (TPR) repeat protein
MSPNPAIAALRTRSFARGAWIAGAAIVAVVVLAWGTARGISTRRYWADLAQAESDYNSGYYGLAQQRLSALAARWPGDGEVQFRLGIVEMARGRRDEALAAWARVAERSTFAARAAALRGQQLTNVGRFAPAEAVLKSALRNSGHDYYEITRVLGRLYRFEGRTEDVRGLLRESWSKSPDPPAILKELWTLDTTPWAMEAWQTALEKADPNDDRVWLGRANLATMTGKFHEAGEWLAACQKRRPDDTAVWRSSLRLAQAAGDGEGIWQALTHLPAESMTETELLALRAFRAPPYGVKEAVLSVLADIDPGDPIVLERLAAIALSRGRVVEAERLRQRKAEIDRATDRYRKLVLYEKDLAGRAEELEALCATLGRRFDAWAWSMIRTRCTSGKGPIVPAPVWEDSSHPPAGRAGRTLADLLPELRPDSRQNLEPAARAAQHTRPEFSDEAETVGLRFTFDNGQTPLRQVPEIMSGGVAVFDYDGDGWFDVYVVQGGPLALDVPRPDGDHLFRNNGDGTFRDATVQSGIATLPRSYTLGVTVGDYDNDGPPDLFLSRLRSYALLRNRGDGTFEDVTEQAGLGGVRDNPSSAAFADLDNDGDLDLYVCHYMVYDPENPRLCPKSEGEYMYCDPIKLDPAPDHVFRNDRGRFVDVTKQAGFVDPDGRSLGVVAIDLDDDNKVDVYVANDGTANFLFRNHGGFRFEETGHLSGVAASASGGYQASMGIACGDVDGDGRPDLVVTNFYGEASTLYRNLGEGLFTDRTADSGLGTATRYLLGFGTAFIDYDNDGRLDLLSVNGHVNDNRPYTPFAMPTQLLAGDGTGRLTDVSADAGPPWSVLRVARGLASGDLDNDGRIDAVVLAQNEALAYFHNRTKAGHFVTFQLEGTRSSRDALGARVTVESGGRRQVAHRFGGGSYQSASDPRLHFGLGAATAVQSVQVRWPSGQIDTYTDLKADTGYRLREGETNARPLAGFPH